MSDISKHMLPEGYCHYFSGYSGTQQIKYPGKVPFKACCSTIRDDRNFVFARDVDN